MEPELLMEEDADLVVLVKEALSVALVVLVSKPCKDFGRLGHLVLPLGVLLLVELLEQEINIYLE